MSDLAFNLLRATLQQSSDKLLWVVDENITAAEVAAIQSRPNISVVTNRFDIAAVLRGCGFDVKLCDFELSAFVSHSFDRLCYRVSKERAQVHHIINSAAQWLKTDGLLLLSGFKNEGIKTYADKAVDRLGTLEDKLRGDKTAMLFAIKADCLSDTPLDDKSYSQVRLLDFPDLSVYSKPGLFGWDKQDKGSQFLIEQLPDFLSQMDSLPTSVLDLGCGYGYLTLMASRQLSARFTATDNNIAAVSCCRRNMQEHGITGEVVVDDCAANIQQQFDLILCNPPFHQGFDVEGGLTDRFLANTHRLLANHGRALFVVNAFIPLERKAKGLFKRVTTLANNRSFKVIALAP